MEKKPSCSGQQTRLEIRTARQENAVELAKLFVDVVGPFEIYNQNARVAELKKFSLENIVSRISDVPESNLVVLADSKIVGFAFTEDQGGPTWIEWYGVAPDARGHGVGERIIAYLIETAPSRGIHKLWCDTRTNNIPSISLFEKLGFKNRGEFKNHWHGQDFFIWERFIT